MTSLTRCLLLVALLMLGSAAAASEPVFQESDCPLEHAEDIQGLRCGFVEVPENRAKPDGKRLRLAVAVLEALSDNPKPDPLVFLSGGPGGPSVQFVPWRADSPFWNLYREDRDLVFFDQRGTGFSEPRFCPGLDYPMYTAGFRGLPVAEQQSLELQAMQACRAEMLEKGIDFAHYNSITSALDLADLRVALGYPEWNLFGLSYGTRLALTTLREAPQGIRSVVIDSVAPPNARLDTDHANYASALSLAFEQCAADEACSEAFPDLEADFYAMLADLEANPIVLEMADESRFPDGRIVVDGTLMAFGVFQGFYSGDFVEVFPLMVREIKDRNEDVLRAVADGLAEDPSQFSQGLLYAVQCFEAFTLPSAEDYAADRARYPGLAVWHEAAQIPALCEALHSERATPEESRAVVSDVPTLALAGAFDPITPVSNAELALETLANSTLVVVPDQGHGPSPSHECTRGLIARFIDDPSGELDTSCQEALPKAQFRTHVHITPGVSRLAAQTQHGFSSSIKGAAVLVLILLSALLAWPVGWLWRRIRGQKLEQPDAARRARRVAGLMALAAVGFVVGMARAVTSVLEDNHFLLAFGLPGDKGWLLVLPIVAVVGAVLSAWGLVGAWKQQWWGLPTRIHYSLVALAGLGFVAWTVSLGFVG